MHREPNGMQLDNFQNLSELAKWGKIPGLIGYGPSPFGSLVEQLGLDADAEIDEFANFDVPYFTDFVR